MKTLRWVLINVSVLLGLLLAVNLASAVILEGKQYVYEPILYPMQKAADPRADLTLYPDKAAARTIYRELFAMGFRYEPFVGWSRNPYAGKTTTIDADGDRVVVGGSEDATTPLRFFGGSAMWGTGVADNHTIPAFVAAKIRGVPVFNHSESGLTSRQGLARLINLANQKTPLGLVVFYDGANDVADYCRPDVSVNGHSRERQIRARMATVSADWSLSDHLDRSHLGRFFFGATRAVLGEQGFGVADAIANDGDLAQSSLCRKDQAHAERVAETLIENWRLAKTIVEASGGRFLAILQPVAWIGRPRTDHLSADLLKPYLRTDFEVVYGILRDRLRQRAYSWIADATGLFDTGRAFYIDVFHVTADGNRRVADFIEAEVRARSLLN